MLANLLNVPAIEFVSSEEVREALRTVAGTRSAPFAGGSLLSADAVDRVVSAAAPSPGSWVDIPPYQGDTLVRGSESLAKTRDGHLTRAVL